MQCPTCDAENPNDARRCACGATLTYDIQTPATTARGSHRMGLVGTTAVAGIAVAFGLQGVEGRPSDSMLPALLVLIHSLEFAARNLVKFPLLVFTTCVVCSVAWFVSAQFVSRSLSFAEVQRLALQTFRDLSVLLASLSPACLTLAMTLRRADATGLQEYPLFLGLNVVFIAACGSLALERQARAVLGLHALGLPRSLALGSAWLALSLLVAARPPGTCGPSTGLPPSTRPSSWERCPITAAPRASTRPSTT
ncbi:MAG: hypothetical protein HY901_28050 [Deltaproteobacteria bacterium]|nr:hypothetical protein [Deltaproteobacteria bacterium]